MGASKLKQKIFSLQVIKASKPPRSRQLYVQQPKPKRILNDERKEKKKQYEATGRTRKFLPRWMTEFPWLRYDDAKNKMFCAVCQEHHDVAFKDSGFVKGYRGDKFRHQTIEEHRNSNSHAMAERRDISDQLA